ncbi:MAG: glycerol-3-phosphate dehydrogenase/oxidase [Planctomycetia bacterium]|nr:glycerol-3-phosphate dehydrogenase/oxidase [Planctomycetia bacterium]
MSHVLILGAGINGAALARELALNGVAVNLVDRGDIAGGTTACSSHLIHGGLRYLEHGELGLVRESLAERTRLLRLAPQFVRPLRLFIPVRRRLGGFLRALGGWWRGRRRQKSAAHQAPSVGRLHGAAQHNRGLWVVRLGLWLYDRYARDRTLPEHRVYPAADPAAIPLDNKKVRWQCAYYDGFLCYPERFVLAMLADAQEAANDRGVPLRVFTYHEASLSGREVVLRSISESRSKAPADAIRVTPDLIVNATGAWVDETLRRLNVPSNRLIGGTKGSHFVTYHAGLRERLAGRGIYAEAPDGRPVFILPLCNATLVGTTDLPFERSPEEAIATPEELDYLLAAVNNMLGREELTRADIAWHYSGVRPLPHHPASETAAITRRHFLVEHDQAPLPMYSIVGGKLTTCRSLAQSATATILKRLGLAVVANSSDRVIPGGENYPPDPRQVESRQAALAGQYGLSLNQIAAIWRLHGTRTEKILVACRPDPAEMLADSRFPTAYVRWLIRNEWVTNLEDLVCRRLMLLYQGCSRRTLLQLAELLVETKHLRSGSETSVVDAMAAKLTARHGYNLR